MSIFYSIFSVIIFFSHDCIVRCGWWTLILRSSTQSSKTSPKIGEPGSSDHLHISFNALVPNTYWHSSIYCFFMKNVIFHNYIHEICIWEWKGHCSKTYEINEIAYGCLNFQIFMNTGMPRFERHFIVLRRCCIFYNWKSDPPPAKR